MNDSMLMYSCRRHEVIIFDLSACAQLYSNNVEAVSLYFFCSLMRSFVFWPQENFIHHSEVHASAKSLI